MLPWDAVVAPSAALERYREIAALGRERPLDERAAALADAIAGMPFDRAALARGLGAVLARLGAPAASCAAAASIEDPSTVLVVTGQQPGFLGGPLYSLYKAAHAVVLAARVRDLTGRPCVPVFWNHSDDHDLDETRGVSLVDREGIVHRISLDLGRGRPFLADLAVPASAVEVNDRVRALLPRGADRDRVLELFLPRVGERFADATSRILLRLLGDRGLVVFEPRDLRVPLSRALAAVVRGSDRGLRRLLSRNEATRARQGEPSFDDADPALVFERTPAGRERVHWTAGVFVRPSGERLTTAALAEAIEREPEAFSAGVAARCAVEALALPVVATIRGPGELAYTPSAYDFLPDGAGRPIPVEVPRFAATLVEPRIAAILGRAGVSAASLVASRGAVLDTRPAPPPPAEAAELEALEHDVAARLRALEARLRSLDANLARPFEKTLVTSCAALAALRARVERAGQEAAGVGVSRLQRARAALVPGGSLQERLLPAAPFLCAALDARIGALLAGIPPVPTGHVLFALGDDLP